jgi:hypothetical protein
MASSIKLLQKGSDTTRAFDQQPVCFVLRMGLKHQKELLAPIGVLVDFDLG